MDIKFIFGVIGGAFAGSAVTFIFCKKKLEAQYEAEIAESKAYYAEKLSELDSLASKAVNGAKMGLNEADLKAELGIQSPSKNLMPKNEAPVVHKSKVEAEYDRDELIKKMNYGEMYVEKKERGTSVVTGKHTEVISDDEYYSNNDYTKKIITYYSESKDFVDEQDRPLEYADVIDGIGSEDFLGEFGEFETDVLFVRNFDEEVDYQIILEEDIWMADDEE